MRWCVVFLCHYVGLLHIIKRRRLELSGLFLVSYGKVTLIEITGCRDEREERLCSCYALFSYKANILILRLLDNILPIYSLVCLLVRGRCRAGSHGSLRYSDTVLGHVCNLSLQISGKKRH